MRPVIPSVMRLVLAALLLCCAQQARAQALSPELQTFREIYRELVEINTTDSEGDTLQAAQAMAARLKAGGFPEADIKVISTAPRKGNLVARLRGTGARKPLLLLAHIDVVEAKRADWAFDPFKLQEVDGYFRARGAADDKAMAAIFVANLIEYVKAGYKPERDIILALTTDEELSDSPHDGAKVLLSQHRDLVDAELALNEGGGGILRDGKPWRLSVQLAEKVYQTYRLEVKDRGGHSASGRRDSAIYRLADGLVRLARFDFPARLNPVTKGFLENVLKDESFQNAEAIRALLAGNSDASALAALTALPSYNAIIRTTCVATMLDAGHAENALPQTAAATVNCRILPDADVADVQKTLVRVLDDPNISVTPIGTAVASPPSPLDPQVMGAVERIAATMWPGVPVMPSMSGGYTDSRWVRNAGIPAYGISGIFNDPATSGVHGLNEQVGVQALYDGKTFLDRLVRELAGPARPAGP